MVTFISQPQLRFRAAPEADFSGLGDVVSNALRERALGKDLADAAAVGVEGGSSADVMARLASGRTVEARESGLTGLLRARADEAAADRQAAADAESARRFGVETGLRREALDIQRAAANRVAAQPTFQEKEEIKRTGKEKAMSAALRRGEQQVLGAVDALIKKVGAPGSKEAARFESATGPIEDTMIGRAGGVAASFLPIVGEGARRNLSFLAQVKQDAQAINTLMQRALLKGGGSITENEREQINQILGGITTAPDARSARELLGNFRSLVGSIFGKGAQPVAPQAETVGAPQQAGSIPPPPPGFEVVR